MWRQYDQTKFELRVFHLSTSINPCFLLQTQLSLPVSSQCSWPSIERGLSSQSLFLVPEVEGDLSLLSHSRTILLIVPHLEPLLKVAQKEVKASSQR